MTIKLVKLQSMLKQWYSGPFHWVTLHVLEIKKIYQRIVNYVNISILKLEKRYLHQNGVEFHQQFIGNQIRGATRQKKLPLTKLMYY